MDWLSLWYGIFCLGLGALVVVFSQWQRRQPGILGDMVHARDFLIVGAVFLCLAVGIELIAQAFIEVTTPFGILLLVLSGVITVVVLSLKPGRGRGNPGGYHGR